MVPVLAKNLLFMSKNWKYNDINYLNNKLKNNNLTLAEYKKISNDTDQLKKSISKKEKELYELKKSAKKRTKTDQAKSFKDQNK